MRPFRQRNSTKPSSDGSSTDRTAGDAVTPAVDGGTGGDTDGSEDDLARIAAELEVWDESAPAAVVPQGERGRRMASLADSLKGTLTAGLAKGGSLVGSGTRSGALHLVDRLVDAAPRIPVRDLATLRAQHPGARNAEDLADSISSGAVKASASVGAGVGAVAMLPVPPAMAVEIGAELLAVAAVEVKMIAELYQAYGQPPSGNATQRAGAYLAVWSQRRGLDLSKPGSLVALGTGAELRRQLRKRLTRTGLRKLPSVAPLMVGALAGATLNRRDTAKLALEIRKDLRGRPPADSGYWEAALVPRPEDPKG
ncbi:hypothetical protein [Streptacidiphilus carbonis]|jgi:hypothetical protein|uniref:hypothetical protein n=1 Tax=Streptacidiphilus carbonis TaxID=105422 RepID=UPI000694FF94|nr:hypothetical protein [Streptacidiphilus carbonis]